jgi:DNA-binding SARP family transcriptional activator
MADDTGAVEVAPRGVAPGAGVPSPARPSLVRSRLLDQLTDRWNHRVSSVVASAGFGKTTLLAQAFDENRVQPRGTDVWVACRPDDAAGSRLAARVASAVGLVTTPGTLTPATAVADHIAQRSPEHLCLLVDDCHVVAPSSPGAVWLGELVEGLPSNGHVVLAGRPPLPVSTARLRALGEAVHVGELDLAFTPEETEAFAGLRLVATDTVAACGGWPALAELMASAGADPRDRSAGSATVDYLWEEVLAELSPPRRRLLALILALGGADDELLSAAAEERVDIRDVTRAIPLSTVTTDGWAAVHQLWEPAMASVLTPTERNAARRRASQVAWRRGDAAHAFRLAAAAGEWADARAIGLLVCSESHPLVSVDELDGWRRVLERAGYGDAPETALLGATARKPADPLGSLPIFEQAGEGFRRAGAVEGEAAALFHRGHILWWHESHDELLAVAGRCAELAGHGSVLAASLLDLGALVLAEISDDAAGVVAAADAASRQHQHPEIEPMLDWLAARGWLMLGQPDKALALAERALERSTLTMRPVAEFQRLACLWHMGRPEEALAEIDAALDALETVGWAHNRAADGAQAAIWAALRGDEERAGAFLARAQRTLALTGTWARALLGVADAVRHVVGDDEAAAGRIMADELAARPLDDPAARRAHRPWAAISYVLSPASRERWDAADVQGDHADTLAAARALVAARAHGSLAEARGLRPDQLARLPTALPPTWIAELATLLAACARPDDARRLLEPLGSPARAVLHRQRAAKVPAVAKAAGRLLADVARIPARPVAVDVLGPLRLTVGDTTWPAQLNRKAVRELLFLLVEQGTVTRTRAAATIWPDLADAAGRNNLRVSLSYLVRALEPHRDPADPPFFVVERGDQIALVDSPYLTVDVWRFRAAVASARLHEQAGTVDATIEASLEAVALYRGDYLADAVDVEWTAACREQVRADFVRAAVRAGELLTAHGDHVQAAALAHRAIEAEPWSERARRLLIEAHLAAGERAAALRARAECRAMLDELGVEPEAATQQVFRRLAGRAG